MKMDVLRLTYGVIRAFQGLAQAQARDHLLFQIPLRQFRGTLNFDCHDQL